MIILYLIDHKYSSRMSSDNEIRITIVEQNDKEIKQTKQIKHTYTREEKMRILGEFLVSIFLCIGGLLFIGGFLYFFIKFIVY